MGRRYAPQNLNKIYFKNLTENILNDFELRFLKDFKPDRAPPKSKEKFTLARSQHMSNLILLQL